MIIILIIIGGYKKFIMPIFWGCHWTLVVVDFEKYEIIYYDSLLGDNMKC